MDGTTIIDSGSGLPGVAGKDWIVKGVGDFNGDGKSDIVFQNTASANGAVYIWEMNGATIVNPSAGDVGNAGKDWVVKGVGDFNGDGLSDIVFQNTSANGAVYIWEMNETTIANPSAGYVGNAGKDWAITGVGDYNGDGKSDIVFQNANASGSVYVWEMNGAQILNSGAGSVATAGTDWHATA